MISERTHAVRCTRHIVARNQIQSNTSAEQHVLGLWLISIDSGAQIWREATHVIRRLRRISAKVR
eukprot:2094845-Rhodomonas_salina.1